MELEVPDLLAAAGAGEWADHAQGAGEPPATGSASAPGDRRRVLDLFEADERKVKQVVFNLLSNAVKFTPDGGRVEVSARAVRRRGAAHGAGHRGLASPPRTCRTCSTSSARWARATPPPRAQGTGLGLALARKFVELYGPGGSG